MSSVIPAPFLRWAGGKRRLLQTIIPSLPTGFDPTKNKIYEPFVGGGAVMFGLGDKGSSLYVPGKRLVINDVNPDLMATYKTIRDDVEGLIVELTKMAQSVSQTSFEKVKKSSPSTELEQAARFIYLNKTCFNGLWRVNSKGEFNVPYGHVKNPVVCNSDLLRACSAHAQRMLRAYSALAQRLLLAQRLAGPPPPFLASSARLAVTSWVMMSGVSDIG